MWCYFLLKSNLLNTKKYNTKGFVKASQRHRKTSRIKTWEIFGRKKRRVYLHFIYCNLAAVEYLFFFLLGAFFQGAWRTISAKIRNHSHSGHWEILPRHGLAACGLQRVFEKYKYNLTEASMVAHHVNPRNHFPICGIWKASGGSRAHLGQFSRGEWCHHMSLPAVRQPVQSSSQLL